MRSVRAIVAVASALLLAAAEPAEPLRPDQHVLLAGALAHGPDQGLPAVEAARLSSEALERAVLDYASALRGQRLAGRFPDNWALRPPAYDAAGAYRAALADDALAEWLIGLEPDSAAYQALKAALARYREIAATGGWADLPGGPVLKAGDRDPRIAALRQRIAIEGRTLTPAVDEALFDDALVETLKAEQARLGVPVSGVLDKATTAAFNIPIADRLAAIEANLERERWLPRAIPDYRIEANVAGPDLAVWRGGAVVLAMRVIAGRKADPTPLFTDRIEAVVLNPPWNVPASIARKEILPKAAADPGYLARNGYVFLPDGGLQQKAGPKAALGLIKLDLGNAFAVDLHDTPSRDLFSRDARALSHGCMRVEKPLDLARLVLEGDPDWDPATIDAAIASGRTVRIPVNDSPAVWVVYRTAFVQDGQVNFRKDVYDWDAKLRRLLKR